MMNYGTNSPIQEHHRMDTFFCSLIHSFFIDKFIDEMTLEEKEEEKKNEFRLKMHRKDSQPKSVVVE